VRESATPITLADHRAARERRSLAARSFPQERVPLSYLLAHPEEPAKLTVEDFAPLDGDMSPETITL
jgi:hypothetical protein